MGLDAGRQAHALAYGATRCSTPKIVRWGDLSAIYKWRGQSFSGTIRGNPSTGKGAGQLAWTTQPLLGPWPEENTDMGWRDIARGQVDPGRILHL